MNSKLVGSVLVAFCVANAGCVGQERDVEENVAEVNQEMIRQNGLSFNGIRMYNGVAFNGLSLNGKAFNGIKANGFATNGTRINGMKLNGIKKNGTGFEGMDDQGVTLEGLGFLGAEIPAELADGTAITIVISDISETAVPGAYAYNFTIDGESICGDDAQGNPILAVPLGSVWNYETGESLDDPDHFTIACRGAALAKCFEMGYPRVGTNAATGVSNSAYHDACVRMVRADYCGDGVSHTHDGTLVDIWDNASIQTETTDAGMHFEARWGPGGASCITRPRWIVGHSGNTLDYLTNTPACAGRYVGPTDTTCGTSFGTTDLIRNATGQNDYPVGQ